MASCIACKLNDPMLRRHNCLSANTTRKPFAGAMARMTTGELGTHQVTTAMPETARAAVKANNPLKPTCEASTGASAKDSMNIQAMLMPTNAMLLVRTCERVMSANSAVTAADIAPAPCNARPTNRPSTLAAMAATTLPSANMAKPSNITGLRPKRSLAMPNGICRHACVRPYTPIAKPTRAASRPPG